MSWPHIEHNMKTRKDCYHFLIEKLGEQGVASYEYLEKYFVHIGFSPARGGGLKSLAKGAKRDCTGFESRNFEFRVYR